MKRNSEDTWFSIIIGFFMTYWILAPIFVLAFWGTVLWLAYKLVMHIVGG